MSSRIAKPGGGQTDQRKIYLNWANHFLRKAEDGTPITDLKEVADGHALPRVLKAVVQEAVPGIHATVNTDQERRENIEKCIQFLEKVGVKCSSFTTKDLCEGKDRAILALFYSLSQFKRNPSSSSATSSSSPAPSKSAPQPSRIARPTSPSLKTVLGININGPNVSAPPQTSSPQASSPQSPQAASKKEFNLSVASMSPPATSPVSPNPSSHKMGLGGGPRRTAGSSIMTSTTFDRPYMHRKPQKTGNGEETKTSPTAGDTEGSKVVGNGQLSMSDSHVQPTAEVKSDPENDENPSKQKTTKLTKHSSFSFGQSPHSRLLKPGASKGTAVAEKAESATPPTQSKLKGPAGGSKLQAPAQKASKDGGEVSQEQEAPAHTGSSGASRLKFPGSGRSTPSSNMRSGIQRPSSRLSKMGSCSTSNLVGEEEEETGASRLRLQRKASDGAVKRHLVAPSSSSKTSMPPGHMTGHVIQSGTSSLPRNMPKGSLSPRQPGKGLSTSYEHESKTADHTKADEVPTSGKLEGKPEGKPDGKAEEKQQRASPSKDIGGEKSSSSKTESGLRKPGGGLKKPGSGPLSGVRTPNLPSSGPQSSTTASSQGEPERGHTPQKEEGVASGSPSLGKKLMQPKLSTGGLKPPGSLESRLKRAASPSARHKLHRIAPAGTSHGADHTPVGDNPVSADANHTPANINHAPPSAGQEPPLEAKPDPTPLNSINSVLTSSSSSLDSEIHGGTPTSQRGVPGQGAELQKTDESKSEEKLVNDIPQKPPVTNEVEAQVKTTPIEAKEEIGKEGHLRFGRRISPEGMSHEEISSPKGDVPEDKEDKLLPQSPPMKTEDPLLSSGDADSSSTEKEVAAVTGTVGGDSHLSRFKNSDSVEKSPSRSQRARSLSPKSPHRLLPKGMARVRDFENGGAGLTRTISSESTSSEGGTPSLSRKPLKSSLRQKRGGSSGSKSRHSSSSSLEGVISPSGPRPKVTISPRSSQVVYDPEATGLHPLPPNNAHKFLSVGVTSERPSSFASLDSSTTSESLSPSNSTSALYTRPQGGGGGVARHASMRTTMSEQLEYRSEHPQFLSPVPGDAMGSTPELIESFENQLTNMKAELSDKDRMLSMYANSMSDLNTKMHLLKKSLEEKDNAIRHLTEKQSWLDLESHSPLLSASRAPSVAADHEALSDGYLSDSAMDDSKDKKKKKQWKNPFRKKKDGGGDHLSPNMDTESIISGRSAKSLKRSFGKKRAPDLMSISEDPPRFMKDIDTKSTYTMDLRSEYGGGGLGPLWEDEEVKVYDDPEPGARAEVVLYVDTNEPRPAPANDSGYYGDILGRNKWSRDSRDSMASSVSSDSGNHSDEACEQFVLGTLSVAPEVSWVSMDTKIGEIFQHHLMQIDPENILGLSEDSVYCYFVGEERRQVGNALLPPITPYEALANKLTIKLHMKGAGQQCCDSLAYKTLMGTESLQSYMTILHETQWLVVMGTKGTCKSSLVGGLAQHLSICLEAEEGEGMEDILMGVVGGEIIRFNLDKEGVANPLKYFKTDLVKRVQLQLHPPIVVLEDVYECKDLEQLLVAAGSLSRRPYIIAALSSGTTKGIPLHQLLFHHQIRLITCNPQTEPVAGVLARSLRKQVYQLKATAQSLDPVAERLVNWVPYLLKHLNSFINKFHSNVVNFGPRVFMSCPLHSTAAELESWFHSLWNHFIIPYLMGTIMAGIETYTADPSLEWVDVREWVIEMYPWPSAINVSKLRTLNPEDVGWNHAVRPHQSRFIMVNDKLADDTRSLLHETQSIIR